MTEHSVMIEDGQMMGWIAMEEWERCVDSKDVLHCVCGYDHQTGRYFRLLGIIFIMTSGK